MPRYLINLTDANAARLEAMLGGALRIGPAWSDIFEGVLVAGLDAVTDEELAPILERLRTSGPLYHHGGPAGAEANKLRVLAARGELGPTAADASAAELRAGRLAAEFIVDGDAGDPVRILPAPRHSPIPTDTDLGWPE